MTDVKHEISAIQKYWTSCSDGWITMEPSDKGAWVSYADYAELEKQNAQLTAENERLKHLLAVSEDFRTAYQDGKYKLYEMGGAICEAAADHLPMSEGPLDRACRKEVGRPQIRAEVAECDAALRECERLAQALQNSQRVISSLDVYNRYLPLRAENIDILANRSKPPEEQKAE